MQESHDVVTTMGVWWDDSHDWGAAVGGYKLFRSYRDEKEVGWLCTLEKVLTV